MTRYMPRHTPAIPITNSICLSAYAKGYEDALNARVYEPRLGSHEDERAAYKAGFDKARE